MSGENETTGIGFVFRLLALFRPALRAKLGAAFDLGTAFGAELLVLNRLAALAAEFRIRRNAGSAVRTRPNDRLVELFFGHVGCFLRHLPRLLHGRIRLRRRVFGLQIRRAIQAQAALRIPSRVVHPFGAAFALLEIGFDFFDRLLKFCVVLLFPCGRIHSPPGVGGAAEQASK